MAEAESLPNRQWELIGASIAFLILGTASTVWRVFVRTNVAKWLGPSDWLMILGVITNNVDCVFNMLAGFAGAGRLQRDPFLTIVQKVHMQKYLFIGQILNIYAMFLIKLSVCTYLLALNFSKLYRHFMWATLIFVVIFNFIFPSVSIWGLCRPLAARWDTRITDKVCWPVTVRIAFGYMQSVSNIMTDLMYATAPIIYLREVQLRKRTQWGVRAVFIMSLLCTTVSALKIWDQERHKHSTELAWDLVSMTLWATAENTVGIMVANLPLLRKPFERLFRSFFPSHASNAYSSNMAPGDRHNTFRMQSQRSRGNQRSVLEGTQGRNPRRSSTGDDESDKAILEDSDFDAYSRRASPGIMKTTEVTVSQIARKQ